MQIEVETTLQCHCGEVTLGLSRTPVEVFDCNCSICQKLGVLWSYYHCDEVDFTDSVGATDIYQWNKNILEFHRCKTCGCTTHWIAADKTFREKMGVNARLIDRLTPDTVQLQHIDDGGSGAFWTAETERI